MSIAAIQAVLDAVPFASLCIGQNGQINAANGPARALLGGGQIIEWNYVTILRQPALISAITAVINSEIAQSTARYQINDGTRGAVYRVSCRALHDAGTPLGVILIFEDITDGERIDQRHRDFVANVSHELRTPLTSVMGFIEALRGPAKDDPAARARFLSIMQDEAARMERLIDDLLLLNQVERTHRVAPAQRVCVNDVLSSVLHAMQPQASGAGVQIKIETQDVPVWARADQDQLRQVFINLIDNAIKYGGKHVRVHMGAVQSQPIIRALGAHIDISDDGPGIDPVHVPRLTERFYRADTHRARASGGTGLGLAIVKHILSRHKGHLGIKSTPERGTTFRVILPVTEPDKQ